MFGSSSPAKDLDPTSREARATPASTNQSTPTVSAPPSEKPTSRTEKRASAVDVPSKKTSETPPTGEKKRRSSGVSKARDILSSAKNSLHLGSSPSDRSDRMSSSLSRSGKGADPALQVPAGSFNNSAGESKPGPRSTFRVGVTEDKNKKCRRTMEDTHAYLYNFLSTPAPNTDQAPSQTGEAPESPNQDPVETDNGYFAIFDGHAGTFAAEWCGKKLHLVLEEEIRRNPNRPIPELLDQTFTSVDQQLEKLPLKNSGCTAVIAVLRWEDRIPPSHNPADSAALGPVVATAGKEGDQAGAPADAEKQSEASILASAIRQRVLYTANVGDARIVLCRNGRALRLSYDHKGSDESEGRRVANAGGLILNNRVNGVLAVTRALGDAYMKDLVTGHPYTTETVIQPEVDEFLILACDGLWDVCSDQEAVDLVRNVQDPQEASKQLVDYALSRFSTDNLSCMLVRFDNKTLLEQLRAEGAARGSMPVDGASDPTTTAPTIGVGQSGISEAEAIVRDTARHGGGRNAETLAEDPEATEDADPGPELDAEALAAAQAKRKSEQLAATQGETEAATGPTGS